MELFTLDITGATLYGFVGELIISNKQGTSNTHCQVQGQAGSWGSTAEGIQTGAWLAATDITQITILSLNGNNFYGKAVLYYWGDE